MKKMYIFALIFQVEGKEAESVPPYKRFTKNFANKSVVNGADELQEASEPSTSGRGVKFTRSIH
jgi:hypothetical protein